MTLYQKMLYELVTKNVVSKVALRALAQNQRRIDRVIKKARESGHVKEFTYIFQKKYKRLTVDCLRITASGLKYFRQSTKNIIPWSKFITLPEDGKLVVLGSNHTRNDLANRYAKMSMSAIMADCIGAEESVLFCSDYSSGRKAKDEGSPSDDKAFKGAAMLSATEASNDGLDNDDEPPFYLDDDTDEFDDYEFASEDEDQNNSIFPESEGSEAYGKAGNPSALSEIVKQARSQYERERSRQFQNGFPAFPDDDEYTRITFTNALTMKRGIGTDGSGEIKRADLSGRYCGMLDSHSQTVLIYAADRIHPLSWNMQSVGKEVSTFRAAKEGLHPDDDESWPREDSAVFLVPDARAFKATYETVEEQREKERAYLARRKGFKPKASYGTSPLGEGFNHFWIIPVNYQGTRELEGIMRSEPMVDEMELIPQLLRTMRYMTNSSIDEKLLPLKDLDGALVTVQPHLDVPKMTKVRNYMTRFCGDDSDVRFVVLCYEWQEPYWKAVIPDVQIRFIESETDEMGLRRFRASLEPDSEKFWIEKVAEAERTPWMPDDAELELDFPL